MRCALIGPLRLTAIVSMYLKTSLLRTRNPFWGIPPLPFAKVPCLSSSWVHLFRWLVDGQSMDLKTCSNVVDTEQKLLANVPPMAISYATQQQEDKNIQSHAWLHPQRSGALPNIALKPQHDCLVPVVLTLYTALPHVQYLNTVCNKMYSLLLVLYCAHRCAVQQKLSDSCCSAPAALHLPVYFAISHTIISHGQIFRQ